MKDSRRIHRRLFVEELEPRVAPVTLSSLDTTRYFNDTDGDLVMIKYSGTGTAHVLFGAGTEDPGATDEILSITLSGATLSSKLVIQDANAKVGGESVSGGAITGQVGEDMGTIQLTSKLDVRDTDITIQGALKGLIVKGNATNVDLTTTGTGLVTAVTFGGFAEDCEIDVGGDLTKASIKTDMTDGFVHVAGLVGSLSISGSLTNTLAGITPIDVTGSLSKLTIGGSVNNAAGAGTAFLSVGQDVSSLTVKGALANTDDGATNHLYVGGLLGKAAFSGDINDTRIWVVGESPSWRFGGSLDNVVLDIDGLVKQATFSLGIAGSVFDFAQKVTTLKVMGGGSDTAINLPGGADKVYLYGNATNLDVAVTGYLLGLNTKGTFGAGSSVAATDGAKQVSLGGPIDGSSQISVAGDVSSFRSAQGITNNSSVELNGTTITAKVSGPKLGASIDGTSSLTLNNLDRQFTASGEMLGTVTVNGGFGDRARVTFSTPLRGLVSFTTGIDCSIALKGIESGGRIETAGDMTAKGIIKVSGDVNTAGETSLYVAGSVYGSILISGNHYGLLDVDGNVCGILEAENFDSIDIGIHATETGDLRPGADVIATDKAGTIASIIIHGRCYGYVSDPTNLEEHDPLLDVFTLNPGESETYADADGDFVIITYNGDGGSSVEVTMSGAGSWRDIGGIAYTNAATNSSLDISVAQAEGNGWTTAGDIDAAGYVIGSVQVQGPIGALVAGTIGSGNVISTWSGLASGNVDSITIANDVAGRIEIGGSLTGQILVGGDLTSTAAIVTNGVPSGEGCHGPNAPLVVNGAIALEADLVVIKAGTHTGQGNVYLANCVDTPVLTPVTLYNLTSSTVLSGAYARILKNDKIGHVVSRPNNDYSDIDDTDWELPEVSAYYYIDRFHGYLAFLGYGDKWNRPISITVNMDMENAYYYPATKSVAYGMPDGSDVPHSFANDGDTVIHEYSHAWSEEMFDRTRLGYGNDVSDFSSAIDEALADYRAASFFNDSLLFEPDGPAYWRNMNNSNTYPYDICVWDEHETGLILGGVFWDLRIAAGQTVADTLSLEMLPYLQGIGTQGSDGLQATFANIHQAMTQADAVLYGGAHAAAIDAAFQDHGIDVAAFATLAPSQTCNFTDSDGDVVTVQYTGSWGFVEVFLEGPVDAYTGVSIVYHDPDGSSTLSISADGTGNNRTPSANLFSGYGVVIGSATVEGPIGSMGSGVIASGETVSNSSAGASGTLGDFFLGGDLEGALIIGGDMTGYGILEGSLSGDLRVLGDLSGWIDIGTDYMPVWADITETGQLFINGNVSGGKINVYGYVDGKIDVDGDVTGTAGSEFLYVQAGVWTTGIINVDGNIVNRSITIDGHMYGLITAGRFGDVYIGGYFAGKIGDGGTAAGVDNTLTVGATSGGTVTPGNAFEYYYGYP